MHYERRSSKSRFCAIGRGSVSLQVDVFLILIKASAMTVLST